MAFRISWWRSLGKTLVIMHALRSGPANCHSISPLRSNCSSRSTSERGRGLRDRTVDRRRFLLTSLAGVAAAPIAAGAQQAGKVYRIGWLSGGFAAQSGSLQAFSDTLREAG